MIRKLLILSCLLAVDLFSHAQTLSPAASTPECPNTTQVYQVTDINGSELGIDQTSTGFSILTSSLDAQTGNFVITATFSDGPASLVLHNFNTNTTYAPIKLNVSTLKGVTPGFTPPRGGGGFIDILNIPLCSTSSFSYAGPPVYYGGSSSNAAMTTYRWIVPSGWAVNGTVSNGTTPITAGLGVTLTPNGTTGGTIQFSALNNCNPALTPSSVGKIQINRPVSASVLVNGSNTVTIQCGQSNPVTFTVSGVGACITGYKWSMPSGWQDGSGNSITSTVTTTPSLTLTPQPFTAPSNVTVTLMANGSAISADTYTETVLYSQTPPITGISGPEGFCGPTPVTYTVSGLTAGASASTFSVNTSQLTGSITTSSSGNTLTVTNPGGSAVGIIFISASTPTPCGTAITTVPQSQPSGLRVVVGQPAPAILGFNNGMSIAGGTGPYNFTMITPSTAEPIINYSWNIMPHTTISGQNTANVSFSINPPPPAGWTTVSMVVEYETACGWSSFLSTFFMAKPGTGGGGPPPPAPLIRSTPSQSRVAIVADDFLFQPTEKAVPTGTADITTIKAVLVYNTVGQAMKKAVFGGNNKTEYLDLHDLPNGIYFIQIMTSKGTITEKYLVQH